ncbi:hypothetical protein [Rothia kristinae]|uniref:hypothetical protein n=1 Tax=Rothia kristinae TaxID=37923 RepID=UPI0022E2E40A|nr:hypothetical protein [Rothia kristinae]
MNSMNPARELFKIFSSWDSSQEQDAEDQLRLNVEENQRLTLRATRCLRDIKVMLDYMDQADMQETTAAYRDAYTEWFKTVFHYPHNWRGHRFSIREDRLLLALAGQIDLLGRIGPARTEWIQRNSDLLNSKLQEVLRILIEDTTLDPAFKAHAERLIVYVMELLNDLDRTNSFDISEALLLLRTYMDSAKVRTRNKNNREHYEWLSIFISHPLTNTFISGAISAGITATSRAIEM